MSKLRNTHNTAFAVWFLLTSAASLVSLLVFRPEHPFAFYTLQLESRLPPIIRNWANFDGGAYIKIAETGYKGTGLIQAYFPLYPMLVSLIARVPILLGANQYSALLLTGLGLSILCAFYFVSVLSSYLSKLYDQQKSRRVLLVLLLFPSSFFLRSLYNESLFLLLAILAFLCFEQKKYFFTALCCAAAGATRVVGVFLVPSLVISLLFDRLTVQQLSLSSMMARVGKYFIPLLILGFGLFGTLSYMAYLASEFGDPLLFLHVQSEFGAGRQENLVLFPQVVWRYLKIFATVRPIDLKFYAYVQEFTISVVFLLLLIVAWVRRSVYQLPISLLSFSSMSFILPTLTGNFSSMPRYVLVCLPVYIVIAHHLKKKAFVAYCVVSAVLLFFNTMLFFQGRWVA